MTKHMVYRALFSSLLMGLQLFGAQALAMGKSPNSKPRAPLGAIQVESHVTDPQYQILSGDLTRLKELQFSNPNPEMLRLMGLNELSGNSLIQWIEDRVHYLVGEEYKSKKFTAQHNYPYAQPDQLPESGDSNQNLDERVASEAVSETTKAFMVMSNIGAGVYCAGKKSGRLYGFALPGIGKVNVTSPRTGIIKVGAGLFSEEIWRGTDIPKNSIARFGVRMAAFIHEARHSDGNGKSAAFLHPLCPKGHSYENQYACDHSVNGPYTVDAGFLGELVKNCQACTAQELGVLKGLAADSLSRVLPGATEWDATPEGL